MAQRVKNLLGMWETQVKFLGRKDPLEKEMATHSSILDWRVPWTEEPGGLHSWGHRESDTTEQLIEAQHSLCVYTFVCAHINKCTHVCTCM